METSKNKVLSKIDKFYELKIHNKLAVMPFIVAGDQILRLHQRFY